MGYNSAFKGLILSFYPRLDLVSGFLFRMPETSVLAYPTRPHDVTLNKNIAVFYK